MHLTVTSTPQDTAELLKSEFGNEIKQKKKWDYLVTRTWYQSVQIRISPAANNGTNISISTGYTTGMKSILVIVTLLWAFTPMKYTNLSLLLICLVFAPSYISNPLAGEVMAKLAHQTTPLFG